MKRFLFFLFLYATALLAGAFDGVCWQSRLPGECLLASLSIPGAHNAATGEGVRYVVGVGKTQSLTLGEQWNSGVRAFDLRPAVRGSELVICHGLLPTKISFVGALDVIREKLKQHPSEFAIVLLREESDSENAAERAMWPVLVGQAIESLGDVAVHYHAGLRVCDVRGKILFISRNHYSSTARDAFVDGWSHAGEGTQCAAMVSAAGNCRERLQVQDFYATTSNEQRAIKQNAISRFLQLAADAPTGVWTINFISSYSSTLFGCTSMATSAGYKKSAARYNPMLLAILEQRKTERKPLGILFMDYAGCNSVQGGIWHPWQYNVQGEELVRAIAECNF